jgi:hypothetical protein
MKVGQSLSLNPARVLARWVIGFSLVLAVAGCGSSDNAATVKRKSTAKKPVVERSPDLDLVTAVLAAGGKAPVTLKFELPQRPVLDETFGLHAQVTPTQDVAKLQVSFEPGTGLELVDSAPFFQLGKTAAGTPGDHRLGLKAAKEGVYELRATVVTESDAGESASSNFSIPVIVSTAAEPPTGK